MRWEELATWIKIPVPNDVMLKVNEFILNSGIPVDNTSIRKFAQSAISEKVNSIKRETEYCGMCKKLKPMQEFEDGKYEVCQSCRNIGSQKVRKGNLQVNKLIAVDRTEGKCANCGSKYEVVHHIIPIASGGKDNVENLIPLCRKCHLIAHNGFYSNRFGLNRDFLLKFKPELADIGQDYPDILLSNKDVAYIN